jgi:hypothetical protein
MNWQSTGAVAAGLGDLALGELWVSVPGESAVAGNAVAVNLTAAAARGEVEEVEAIVPAAGAGVQMAEAAGV